MRIIHGSGYSERDRAEFKVLVYRNVFIGIQKLIEAMEALRIPYENPNNKVGLSFQISYEHYDIAVTMRRFFFVPLPVQ